jgi:tyrosine-specific transport protein
MSDFADDTNDTVDLEATALNSATASNKAKDGLLAALQEKIGTVEDDRIIFPELVTGEVPRMFSSLQYNKSEQGKTLATHAAGSTLGAACLIAGTTIGGGMLALPSATAVAGFLPSSAALIVAWVYMTMSGLLLAELSLNRMAETGKPGLGVLNLFESSLNKPLSMVGTAAYFFFHYAVMVAYIAQGGINLDGFLSDIGLESLTQIPGQVLFAGTSALALYVADSKLVQKFKNVLVLGVLATFLAIVGIGATTADFGALISPVNQHPELVVNAFPILFLSLVYQNVVPSVVNQLEGDRTKITTAIVGGTLVPLLMFLAWNGVVLGNVLSADPSSLGTIDPVALLQSGAHGGELLGPLVGGFSQLAIVTSLIGFVYGLTDALTEVAKLPVRGPDYEKWKPALFAGVFLPPLALSFHPGVFHEALEYAGAFGVSTLFLVLPPLMVWKARYGEEQLPLATKPMVPLGKIPLGSMWKAAATLIVEQGAEKLGVIDFFQDHFMTNLNL